MAAPKESRDVVKKNNSLRDFQGVNTQSARQVIGDNQFAWLENVMPIGFGNAPAIPGPSVTLATFPSAVYHLRSVNINGTPYEIGFATNGSLYAVNLLSNAVSTIATIATLSGAGSELTQWQNTEALIVDPTNGYFSWDGTTFTKINGEVQSLTVTSIGSGYTSAPTVGFTGGGGSGATATAHISVGLATLSAAGTGYNAGDIVTIAGGTSTTKATLQVSTVGGGGAITGINLISIGDYTAAPANPAASTSLYGTGATFTLNFGVGPVTLTAPGAGYTSNPTVTLTGGAGTGAAITAQLSVVPSGGSSIATYQSRVWIASNRTVAFSAPGSFDDFSSGSGGGSFVVVDSTLNSSIIELLSANNFLYIAGTSSFNVIGDVSVSNGATVFSNTNISASIGTNEHHSVIPYYRAVWFAAPYGIYALYGSTTQKASDDLDGIYPLILNSIFISSGTAVISNILTLCFMFKYEDPIEGARTLIAVYFNKKWFFSSQGDNLIHIDTAIVGGTPVLYSTDGTHLYSLFTNSSVQVNQVLVTKLWDMGAPLNDKQSLKFGLEVINPNAPQTITGTIDTESANGSIPISLVDQNFVTWINDSQITAQWVNDGGDVVQWVASGFEFMPMDVATTGRYLGVTLRGLSAGTVYAGLHLQYEVRDAWPEGGAQ